MTEALLLLLVVVDVSGGSVSSYLMDARTVEVGGGDVGVPGRRVSRDERMSSLAGRALSGDSRIVRVVVVCSTRIKLSATSWSGSSNRPESECESNIL